MATTTEEVKVSISAQITELLDGLKQASGAVKTSTEEMKGQFSSLGSVIDAVKAPLLGFTALLGGGALFKGAIEATINWNTEVIKMSKQLGVSTQDASVLAVALNGLGLTTEMYGRAAGVLARQLAAGSDAFANLGISTTNSNGTLKSSTDLTNEALRTIGSYKEGIDRTAAGVSLFGRQWAEIAPLLKMNGADMNEARERAEKLGLMLGPGSEAQTRAYKLAMIGIDESMKGIQVQVGTALLPTLTTLAKWFAESGASTAASFGDVIRAVVTALMGMKAVVDTVIVAVGSFVQNAISGFGRLADVAQALLNRDFAGAVRIAKSSASDMMGVYKDAGSYITQIWTDLAKQRDELWKKPPPTPVSDPASVPGGLSFTPKEKGNDKDTRLEDWKKELEAKKLEEVNWFTWSKEQEKAFWQEKLATIKGAGNTRREVELDVQRASKEIAKQSHAEFIDGLRGQLLEVDKHSKERIAILREIAKSEADLFGTTSKQAVAANKEIAKTLREDVSAAIKEFEPAAKSMGAAMGTAFADMKNGTKSFADSMDGMTNQIENMVIDMAINNIQAYAASAEAAAAFSQAGIPVIGPLLAIGAAATIGTFVKGLINDVPKPGGVPKAAGGWDIPTGINPLTQLHGGEMVLPEGLANVIRSRVGDEGSGDRGGTTTYQVNISALDSRSFHEALTRNSSSLVRVVKQLTRNGRL